MQGFSDAFSENAAKMQISISEQQMQRFELYADTLVEWNQKMNLTAITDPQGIAVKHFLDSAALLQHVEVTEGSSIIDVGTGAGFPSVPIKLLRPDLRITLLDSLRKRIGFLDGVYAACKSRGSGQKNCFAGAIRCCNSARRCTSAGTQRVLSAICKAGRMFSGYEGARGGTGVGRSQKCNWHVGRSCAKGTKIHVAGWKRPGGGCDSKNIADTLKFPADACKNCKKAPLVGAFFDCMVRICCCFAM